MPSSSYKGACPPEASRLMFWPEQWMNPAPSTIWWTLLRTYFVRTRLDKQWPRPWCPARSMIRLVFLRYPACYLPNTDCLITEVMEHAHIFHTLMTESGYPSQLRHRLSQGLHQIECHVKVYPAKWLLSLKLMIYNIHWFIDCCCWYNILAVRKMAYL